MRRVTIEEQDRIIYEKEIRPFLPDQIFDAHAHLLQNALHPNIEAALPLALDPMLGNVDSLNLATSVAIVMYEILRQRDFREIKAHEKK